MSRARAKTKVREADENPTQPSVPRRRYLRGNGGPGAIRTPDPQIRSLMLYPAELRVRLEGCV
jgi:hypothetical protein